MARPLPLGGVIGFGGTVPGGMVLHPDGFTLIYALGTCVILRQKGDEKSQEFLHGHTHKISCLSLSKSGKYLATGQVTYMGFTADIIIWDLESRKLLHRLTLHKVKVQALNFSCDEEFLASIGGQDDGKLVIWNVKSGRAVCGSPTPFDYAHMVCFFNTTSTKLVTAGSSKLNMWDFDYQNRKVRPSDCHLGHIKRILQTIVIDAKDEFVYAGTHSGDVLQVSLGKKIFRHHGPKTRVENGVMCCSATRSDDLLVGGGEGTIMLLKARSFKVICISKVQGGVTSMAIGEPGEGEGGSFQFYAGTNMCNLYLVRYDAKKNVMVPTLLHTCHYDKINDIAFASGYSEVFATCSQDDIRIWHLHKCHELLHIQVRNKKCLCLAFMPDGKSIISGWNDGRIRAFGPETGKLLYMIIDAHVQGVTAICGTSDSCRIVSGGVEGQEAECKLSS